MADPLVLLAEAPAINSKLVSLARIQLLQVLDHFHPDAIEFRELQAALAMSDGKLLSNLSALQAMGCVDSQEAKVENKTLTTYKLSDDGVAQWHGARAWLIQWLGSK